MKKKPKLIPLENSKECDSVLIFGLTIIIVMIGFSFLIYLYCQS